VFLVLLFLLSVASLCAAASFVLETQRGRSKVFLVMLLCFLLSVCFAASKFCLFSWWLFFSGIHCQEGGLRVGIRWRTEKFCFFLVLLLLRQSPNVGFGFVDLVFVMEFN
jgi:hypothetical protein